MFFDFFSNLSFDVWLLWKVRDILKYFRRRIQKYFGSFIDFRIVQFLSVSLNRLIEFMHLSTRLETEARGKKPDCVVTDDVGLYIGYF